LQNSSEVSEEFFCEIIFLRIFVSRKRILDGYSGGVYSVSGGNAEIVDR